MVDFYEEKNQSSLDFDGNYQQYLIFNSMVINLPVLAVLELKKMFQKNNNFDSRTKVFDVVLSEDNDEYLEIHLPLSLSEINYSQYKNQSIYDPIEIKYMSEGDYIKSANTSYDFLSNTNLSSLDLFVNLKDMVLIDVEYTLDHNITKKPMLENFAWKYIKEIIPNDVDFFVDIDNSIFQKERVMIPVLLPQYPIRNYNIHYNEYTGWKFSEFYNIRK